MAVHLLDVNVLVALAWPTHEHHRIAEDWFAACRDDGWATCPFTQTGFVRLSSNKKLTKYARTPRRAVKLLGKMMSDESHIFWPDDLMITDSKFIALERLRGHGQVTDPYLLGLALKNGGRFAYA